MPNKRLIIVEEDATNAEGFHVDEIRSIKYEDRSSGVGTVQVLTLDLGTRVITWSGADAVSMYTQLKDEFGDITGTDNVVVTTSALPAGAATAAAQALALIELAAIESDTSDILVELAQKLETADLEINDNAVSVGPHGYYGGAWQRSSLPFGYSGILNERVYDANAAAGTVTLDSAAVPAGEIWVVTSVAAKNVNTNPTQLVLAGMFGGGAVEHSWSDKLAPGANVHVTAQGWWVMETGDKVRAIFLGTVLNDDIYLFYSGFKVEIDQ